MTQLETSGREIVQRLSKAAIALDKALAGPPEVQSLRINYTQRQEQQEQAARKELIELKNRLNELEI